MEKYAPNLIAKSKIIVKYVFCNVNRALLSVKDLISLGVNMRLDITDPYLEINKQRNHLFYDGTYFYILHNKKISGEMDRNKVENSISPIKPRDINKHRKCYKLNKLNEFYKNRLNKIKNDSEMVKNISDETFKNMSDKEKNGKSK